MSGKMYSVQQIAEMLEMHPKTIQRYIREGQIKAVKMGKHWRVSGHDLSVFLEGTKGKSSDSVTRVENPDLENRKIRISSVVDIEIADMDEGMRIVNTLMAVLNSKPTSYARNTLKAQYFEEDNRVQLMLWGDLKFMENMMASIDMLISDE